VSWDPRGVGQSAPVTCESGQALDRFFSLPAAPSTPAQVAQVVAATKAFDEGCVRRSGLALLRNVSTAETARDLDRIRAALGDSKLTYLGFSYGTFIGTMYAHLFPTHVRAMVLDGAVDPALTTEQEDLQQAEGFETDLGDFLSWCQQQGAGCPLDQAGGAQASFERALERLQEGPVPAGQDHRSVDSGLGLYGLAEGLYSTQTWPQLADALAGVLRDDGSQLLGMADNYTGRNPNGSYQNILEANTAISCLDKPAPTSLAAYEADAVAWAQAAPVFGPSEAWGTLSCAYWPVPPVEQPGPLAAPGAPPIVVVGSTNDPATPYSWAQALASQLGSGVLVTRVGAGHTGYFFSNCVEQLANAYLVSLKVPRPGTVCPS
jgi:pimeloyl-ACP methyl ester carboxylesterase